MMTTRRRFLKALGVGLVTPTALVADDPSPRRSRWEMIFGNPETATPEFRPDPSAWDDSTITAAWLGHATVLINFFGTKIITDPVFSTRIGLNLAGLFTVGPKRLVAPALQPAELSPIDLILLSHAHMDHLDIRSLNKMNGTIPIIMAKNTADVIDNLARRKVEELDWGEKTTIAGLEVEALRVKHFGWRYPWETDRSRGDWNGRSYNAYLISKNGKGIVFGGDTAYHEYFKVIREREVDVELAILPIGTYNPWIHNHCSPEQALEMSDHMRAKLVLPIHWRTFIQSDEPVMEPIERLKAACVARPERIALESIGQTWSMNGKRTT